MVFSSSLFLFCFFPLFFLIYFLIDQKYKNYTILLFSFLFYQWGAPNFVYTVLTVTFVDFFIVKKMYHSEGIRRKQWLLVSLLLNIGLLAYFKYSNFFIDNVNAALLSVGIEQVAWTRVALPIGISFFAFETLTYAIDVYRRVHAPLKSVLDYYTYILLFPKLIAGPIVRFHEIADQIADRTKEDTVDNKLMGFYRFIIGLSKKVLIANVMAKVADDVFAMEMQTMSTGTAWVGIIAYSLQIYFDFSGYSDMAIGMGRMMGFRFIENFNNPYISQNITEFWRRWHMSLGRWMRDYLYIPLGGNRVSKSRMYFNLWLVFLISGLWHGAEWNFVLWGAFHGTFLLLDRLFLLNFYKKIGKIPSVLITYLIVLVGWVFFRAENLSQAKTYLVRMFSFSNQREILILNTEQKVIMIFALCFAFFALIKGVEKWQEKLWNTSTVTLKRSIVYTGICIILFILSSSYIVSSGFNPFIYFRF